VNDNTSLRQSALCFDQIAREAAAIEAARAKKVQHLRSLGLSVPDGALTFVTARSRAAVDNCVRRHDVSGELISQIIARCEERAGRAA
jgi:hypothetical protein